MNKQPAYVCLSCGAAYTVPHGFTIRCGICGSKDRDYAPTSRPHPALPEVGTVTLTRNPGFSATTSSYDSSSGLVDVKTPTGGFSCLVSDLPYLLLCECAAAAELLEEVERLRNMNGKVELRAARDRSLIKRLAAAQSTREADLIVMQIIDEEVSE